MEALDAATIARVRSGDTDAFRLLVEGHSRALFRLAYRITRNEHDADDVVQESFLRAFRNLHSFDSRSSFSTWMHRITTNCSLDLLRRRNQQPAEELDETVSPSGVDSRPAATHERLVLNLGMRDALARGMKALSGNERTAFVLRHYEGMSIDEIGQTLGTDTNATKHTIFRAVRKLRQTLEPLVRPT